MNRSWACLVINTVALLTATLGQATRNDYLVYVVCESADKIALIRFGQHGAQVDKLIDTGSMPSDIDGPHGVVVSPDKEFYYVSLGHGRPYGSVWNTRLQSSAVADWCYWLVRAQTQVPPGVDTVRVKVLGSMPRSI